MEGKKLTKEERIAVRRNRVASRRNKEDNKLKGTQAETDAEPEAVSMSKKQIKETRQKVDDAEYIALEEVTDIRVNRDAREALRRTKQEQARETRMTKLEKEVISSADVNREIESQWAQIAQKTVPQDLFQEISVQYKAASKLLASKDEIVKSLQGELKVKDEDYVELLAAHQEDIVTLVKHMREHFANLLSCEEEELSKIENVCLEERTALLEKSREEIEALFKKRRDMELEILYAKQTREEDFQMELSKIRSTDAEDYTNLKVTLENNIQLLEQQLEEMRATYQLNTEKLEYNHAVLEERDQENKQTVEHHRQRLRRLKEALSSHKQRFYKQDGKFKSDNQELTEEYKRVTDQFKDLQRKFRHFEMVDHKKYREVWDMNEENVMETVRNVLTADEIIHTQILGMQYVPPFATDASTQVDVKTVSSGQIFNAMGGGGHAAPDGEGLPLAAGEQGAMLLKGIYSTAQVKSVMNMLGGETSFLVDARVKESLRGLSEEESEMYRVDAILSSLGVEDREDLDELVGFFYEDPKAEKPSVHPNDIIKVVREFVVKRQQSKTKAGPQTHSVAHGGVSNEKIARKKERERRFWRNLAEVVNDKTVRVWDALEKTQRDYNDLLEDRAKLIDETTELARQNEELKILLQEYLGSKINMDLQIPPTRLISVDN